MMVVLRFIEMSTRTDISNIEYNVNWVIGGILSVSARLKQHGRYENGCVETDADAESCIVLPIGLDIN